MQRYHGLDALRAFAMLMGLGVHATLPYISPEILERLAPPGTTAPPVPFLWEVIPLWIHQWRMPVFFVLAGFFAALVLERKGAGYFLKDRGLRILGTLLVFMTAFMALVEKPWAELHHLWFLWYLVQYSALVAVADAMGARRWASPLLWVLDRPWRLMLLYLPMVPLLLFGKTDVLTQMIPITLWEFQPRGLVYYFAFFLLGLGLWARRARIAELSQGRVWGPVLGASVIVSVLVLSAAAVDRAPDWLILATAPAFTLGLVFGLIGAAQALVRRSSWVLRFLVDSAYAVYLVHLYLLLGLGTHYIVTERSPATAIPLSVLAALAMSIAAYVVLFRYTPLDWLLSGPRKSRMQWPLNWLGWVPPRRQDSP